MTENLDFKGILLIDLNDSFDTSFIVVTHDELMANSMHRKLVLEGGTLHE